MPRNNDLFLLLALLVAFVLCIVPLQSTSAFKWSDSARRPIDYFGPGSYWDSPAIIRRSAQECRFSYNDSRDDGPSHWGTACPDGSWATCGTGQFQSPVDIITQYAIERNETTHETGRAKYGETRISHFRFAYDTNRMHELHLLFDEEDDPYIIVRPDADSLQSAIYFEETTYNTTSKFSLNLTQLHFHVPSENRINGKQFPMEVHLVHREGDGVNAVVGLLFDICDDESNRFLSGIIEALDKRNESSPDSPMSTHLALSDILPPGSEELSFFHFMGSLTTPPCTENIRWFVLEKAAPISTSQLKRFAEITSGNARPPQPVRAARPITFVRILRKEDDFLSDDVMRIIGLVLAGLTVLTVFAAFVVTLGYYIRVGSREGWGGWRPIPTHTGAMTPDNGAPETFMLVDTDEEGGVEMHELDPALADAAKLSPLDTTSTSMANTEQRPSSDQTQLPV